MADLELILLLLLVVDAFALIGLVLIQQGKGADVGAAFGSGSSNTVFGSAGSTSFLTKVTTWLTVGFFAISFGLAYFAKERAGTIDDLGIPQVQTDVPTEIENSLPANENDVLIDALEGVAESAGDSAEVPEELIEAIQEANKPVDSDVPEL